MISPEISDLKDFLSFYTAKRYLYYAMQIVIRTLQESFSLLTQIKGLSLVATFGATSHRFRIAYIAYMTSRETSVMASLVTSETMAKMSVGE